MNMKAFACVFSVRYNGCFWCVSCSKEPLSSMLPLTWVF